MTTAESSDLRDIARRFVDARRSATALPDYPGPLPRQLSTGYAIQDMAIAEDGDRILGWKVGKIGDADAGDHDVNRLAGPIFARNVRTYSGTPIAMPVFTGGFGAAEAEFLLRIGPDVAAGKASYSIDEAAGLVDAVHVGIEIASSPFPGINANGPAVTISDFGNNNGLIIGAEIADWRTSGFERWPVRLEIEGFEVGRATTETMLDGAVGAVRFLLELLSRRGITLAAGTWVSTGAVTGVHEVEPGQEVVARFGTDHLVTCKIDAA